MYSNFKCNQALCTVFNRHVNSTTAQYKRCLNIYFIPFFKPNFDLDTTSRWWKPSVEEGTSNLLSLLLEHIDLRPPQA